jgi:hypothetical protein
MGLSIADVDKWNPESLNAVGAASAARAGAASQATSALGGLSAFSSWHGDGAAAAQQRTQVHANGIEQHGLAASAVATAANTAANEVRQAKLQLENLRSTLGHYGITVDANGSRAVPPTNLSSLPEATRKLVQDVTKSAQETLDRIREAADRVDTHLADALKEQGGPRPAKPTDEPAEVPNDKPDRLVGDPGWKYPWDPPPPSDSAPGGGRWDVDPQPYPSGPGGGPPTGPFTSPKPWHRDIKPPIVGGPTAYQDVVGSLPNGWGVNPSMKMQENYRFRMTGETFNGAPDHTRWVQRDGNWYQAKWVDYNFEAEHVYRGVSGTGFFTPNFGLGEWNPIGIKDIYRAQADNPRLTMYVPTPSGGQIVLDPKRPGLKAQP